MALRCVMVLTPLLLVGSGPAHGSWRRTQSAASRGATLVGELGCPACHAGLPVSADLIRSRAPSLETAGIRFQAAYLYTFLRDPHRVRRDIGASRMPDFGLSEEESIALTLYLQTLVRGHAQRNDAAGQTRGEDERRQQERVFEQAKRTHPDVTAEMGQAIFRALNCAGCHASPLEQPGAIGPDLSKVGRLRPAWLAQYVRHPVAVRPFGFYPGTGSRMPDFGLSDDEADSITTYLLRSAGPGPRAQFDSVSLTTFDRDQALRFIRDKFACLGCHRLDGVGGRIGPDLSGVGARLGRSAVYAMLEDPQGVMPRSVMPRQMMPERRLRLIASYLVERVTPSTDAYLSLTDNPITGFHDGDGAGRALYERFCASCHGLAGEGDGYNAQYLPVTPTRHADSSYMSTRPDDTLFDGIHAGGHILGRSHRMPGFGQRLESDEIRAIIRYIRELCHCEGPIWSRDGRRE
jgi:mono/diheme cytochrome c family protein